jgi:hypothetical protein
MTFSITTLCPYAKCHYAEYSLLCIVRLNVFILGVVMLNVVAQTRIYNNVKPSYQYELAWAQSYNKLARLSLRYRFFQIVEPTHSDCDDVAGFGDDDGGDDDDDDDGVLSDYENTPNRMELDRRANEVRVQSGVIYTSDFRGRFRIKSVRFGE